jgi:hypothetical protein
LQLISISINWGGIPCFFKQIAEKTQIIAVMNLLYREIDGNRLRFKSGFLPPRKLPYCLFRY